MKNKVIYLIGSLKNDKIQSLANKIENELKWAEVFTDWFMPGPEADDFLLSRSKMRGRSYGQILNSYAAQHIFDFDFHHINRSDIGIMYMPAGKSCCLELGYMTGLGKPTFILFDGEPKDRIDVMFIFAKLNGGDICFSFEELINKLKKYE